MKENIEKLYNHRFKSLDKRVTSFLEDTKNTTDITKLNLSEVKNLTSTILELETHKLQDELESLINKKDKIFILLERKRAELQTAKYNVFNSIESTIPKDDENTLSKLHQIKLQSVDLFKQLGDTVESAVLTALERSKDNEVNENIQEVIKDLTFETIKEGTLNTIRVRKILSTILQSSIEIAEATPNSSCKILESTLRGMRSGLLHSIDRFKQRLAYMPLEAKHILIEDYDTIIEDLNQTDVLFLQVIQTQANESSNLIRRELLDINKKMHLDLEELVHISKEAALAMKNRFSVFAKDTIKKANGAMKSKTAQDAKQMGMDAFKVAKTSLASAIKKVTR